MNNHTKMKQKHKLTKWITIQSASAYGKRRGAAKQAVVKAMSLLLVCAMSFAGIVGCGASKEGSGGVKIVLTDGFGKDELFRLQSLSCMKNEFMVYLTNAQKEYENILDDLIWDKTSDGVTLEEKLKDTVLAKISRVKAMALLAADQGIELTEEEKDLATQAAKEYFMSLDEKELELLDISLEQVQNMYFEYALANRVYSYIIKDINPEISDDEARTISVAHILIKTYSMNGKGERVEYTPRMKEKAYQEAQEVLSRLETEEFEQVMAQCNEGEENYYTFMHGQMEENFENAAFMLGKGEISDIIETPDGYEIIKCLSPFDQVQTDQNKVQIVEERKKAAFDGIYEEFIAGLNKNLNEPLWEEIRLIRDEEMKASNFFEIYEKYLGSAS